MRLCPGPCGRQEAAAGSPSLGRRRKPVPGGVRTECPEPVPAHTAGLPALCPGSFLWVLVLARPRGERSLVSGAVRRGGCPGLGPEAPGRLSAVPGLFQASRLGGLSPSVLRALPLSTEGRGVPAGRRASHFQPGPHQVFRGACTAAPAGSAVGTRSGIRPSAWCPGPQNQDPPPPTCVFLKVVMERTETTGAFVNTFLCRGTERWT